MEAIRGGFLMFSEGSINIEGVEVFYSVKHFDKGSEWGIEGGRISKLECRANGKTILHYDRGWDMEPETELGYLSYATLIDKFN